MKNMIGTSLFKKKELFSIGENIQCISGERADVLTLICNNPYPILFVLHGEVKVYFRMGYGCIKQGNFAVISSADLTNCVLSSLSEVMIFYPSERLANLLKMSSKSFSLSISEIIPIRPPLQEWIDKQLNCYAASSNPAQSCSIEMTEHPIEMNDQKRCRELIGILVDYPRNIMETLFMPLYACSVFNCRNCKMR